jgi:hypothetical protein
LVFRALDLASTGERPFSMLGLGDIVVPGIFIAILLRFDNQRNNKGKSYFRYGMIGYGCPSDREGYSKGWSTVLVTALGSGEKLVPRGHYDNMTQVL